MRLPVELLISDKKNRRKLVRVPYLIIANHKSSDVLEAAKEYVRKTWRGHTLISLQEGRLFQE